MEPHIHKGDVIILVSPKKTGIVTWVEGKKTGYRSFGDYGDVIVYHPNGENGRTPIIHRVIAYVKAGDKIPRLVNGKLVPTKYVAKSDGYVTQGDANSIPDQIAPNWNIKPVKEEWIVGVAKLRIPYVGWFRILI
jgi:signal peptidase